MRKLSMFLWGICFSLPLFAQPTFPVNGVADQRDLCYAFTHATCRDGQNTLTDATLVIRDGKISAVGNNITIPADAIIIDCKGKYIYPSFIDIYADYGIAIPQGHRVVGSLALNRSIQPKRSLWLEPGHQD